MALKITVENLHEHILHARQRLNILRLHLDHDAAFHLVAVGSGTVPLLLDPAIARQILENETEKARWVLHDLERKAEIVNRMLAEI